MAYHSHFTDYVTVDTTPIYLNHVEKGRHPRRLFHDHDYMEMTLITAGFGIHLLENVAVPVRRGDLLIVPPGMMHAYDQTQEMALCNIIYLPSRILIPQLDVDNESIFQRFVPLGAPRVTPEQYAAPILRLELEELEKITALFAELKEVQDSFSCRSRFHCFAIFIELLSRLIRYAEKGKLTSPPVNYEIGPAIKYIREHIEEKLTLSRLARQCNMSERNFFRYFKRETGDTPHACILKLRVQKAIQELLTTTHSLKEIAVNCGFYDSNHLIKSFKMLRGVSPISFKRRNIAEHVEGSNIGFAEKKELDPADSDHAGDFVR